MVELLPVGEGGQVVRYLLPELRFQGEGFEGGGVAERDGDPAGLVGAMAIVGEEPPLARDPLKLLSARGDEVEVGREDGLAVALGELEGEAPPLFQRVLNGLHVVGPREGVTVEGIMEGVIRSDGEGDTVGGFGAREGEAAAGGGGVDRIEVEVDMAVEIVDVDAAVVVEFRDLEVGEWGEEVLERLVQGVEKRENLGRQDVLEDS